jgi:hypothetical protein
VTWQVGGVDWACMWLSKRLPAVAMGAAPTLANPVLLADYRKEAAAAVWVVIHFDGHLLALSDGAAGVGGRAATWRHAPAHHVHCRLAAAKILLGAVFDVVGDGSGIQLTQAALQAVRRGEAAGRRLLPQPAAAPHRRQAQWRPAAPRAAASFTPVPPGWPGCAFPHTSSSWRPQLCLPTETA